MSTKISKRRRRRRKALPKGQLSLEHARKASGRGGWRPNAGRPRSRTKLAHAVREDFSSHVPQHVTLRLVDNLPSLREERLVALLRTQIALSHKADFRVIEFCVQHNHLHLIVETDGRDALASGVTGLEVRVSRRLNREWQRTGEVFDDRYHSRSLTTPLQVRNALRYVLNNERHHADERGERIHARYLDPFSSAPWFTGWTAPVATSTLPDRLLALPAPTLPARVWLLTRGWKKHGLIAFDEVPRSARSRKSRARS